MPTQDPERGQTPLTVPAGRSELIGLISSYGATADPAEGELLGALARMQDLILPELRLLREQGRDFLPAAHMERIERSARSLPAAATIQLSDLLDASRGELRRWVEDRRAAVLSGLRSFALALEPGDLTRMLGRIWTLQTVPDDTAGLIASARMLAEAGRQLDAVRASSEGAARRETGRGDIRPHDEDAWLRACEQLTQSCAAARERLAAQGDEAAPPDRLLAPAIEAASRALTRASEAVEPADKLAWQPVLASWDATLQALVAGGPAAVAEGQASRRELAEMLQHNIARHVAIDLGLQDHSKKLPSGDIDGTARTLLTSAISGGSSFQEAFDKALSLARTVKSRADTRLDGAAAGLRDAARRMETFLENAAEHLPVARVMAARLWLEQCEGVIASGEIPSMNAMTHSLTDDLKELNLLMELARKRRQGREASERETLKADAARYQRVAIGGIAGRIQTLAHAIDRTDPKNLGPLRAQIESLGATVEQSVRMAAGKSLAAAERLLRKRQSSKKASMNDRLDDIEEKSESLKAAIEKDDLERIQTLARELAADVGAVSPWSRLVMRVGLGVLALVLTGGPPAAGASHSSRLSVTPGSSVHHRHAGHGDEAPGPEMTGGILPTREVRHSSGKGAIES